MLCAVSNGMQQASAQALRSSSIAIASTSRQVLSMSRMSNWRNRNVDERNDVIVHFHAPMSSSSRSLNSSAIGHTHSDARHNVETPPSPVSSLGSIKSSNNDPFEKSAANDPVAKEGACQTLSPSSVSAPRSQRGGRSTVSSEADSLPKQSPTGTSHEIDNRPAIGRKGSLSSKFRAQKAALTLTSAATERVRALLESSGGPKLLRIGVRNKGCAGMSYHLEYVTPEQAGKFDERVKQDGVEVLIDSKALFSIIGSEMDWQEDRLSAKFVFNNPNVVEACGCGESIRFA